MPYVNSMWDRNSGIGSGITLPVGYCTIFRELRGVYDGKVDGILQKRYSFRSMVFTDGALDEGSSHVMWKTVSNGQRFHQKNT